jgi:hypothetical protein
VLRRIFVPMRGEVAAGGYTRLHNEELHNLYASPSIISVIKSWSVRYVRNIVSMREMRNLYKILVAKLEG